MAVVPITKTRCGDFQGAGTGGSAQFIGAKIGKDANQTIPDNTETSVTFETTVLDSGGFAELASDGIRIPAGLGGVYHVGVEAFWDDVAAPGVFGRVTVTGSVVGTFLLAADSVEGGQAFDSASTLVSLQGGELLTMSALQDSGAPLDLTPQTFLWAYRIGP